MPVAPGEKARDRIVHLIKTRGAHTASMLADALGITAIAVRQHLQSLENEGLLSHTTEKGKVGRPAHLWHLTEAAERLFPDRHRDLANRLLCAVREIHGTEGMREIIRHMARAEMQRCHDELKLDGLALEQRVEAIVAMRHSQGYMAEWSESDDGRIQLAENHCPIGSAACECDEFCMSELSFLNELLGDTATVERTEHIGNGDRRCLYEITPRKA